MNRAIWWIRRDLRLADNQVLSEALSHHNEVVPLFILDPFFINSRHFSKKRLAFLYSGLHQLDASLRKIGSRLIIRRGHPLDVLLQITNESKIDAIYAEADFSWYAGKRDARVAQSLPLQLIGSPGHRHPEEVIKADGTPYIIYTPFRKAWKNMRPPRRSELLPSPQNINTPENIFSEALPVVEGSFVANFPAGEDEAERRLELFTDSIQAPVFNYADRRNSMGLDGTSKLSPYLRFGMLSARRAVVAAFEAAQLSLDHSTIISTETWLNELIWRDFYISILYHYPEVSRQSFRTDMRDIQWMNDVAEFSAWKSGITGYPIVDAGMRQIAKTGWMHNRARMITASFLVKDLLIDWRLGEAYFMSQLVDGDPAANNGGWQWTAGTGTDAAPYFRIFNPVLQGQKFDPQGIYIRNWVPELSNVSDRYIHQPWQMPEAVQETAGCRLGKDYPHPIVDHHKRRQLALKIYRKSR